MGCAPSQSGIIRNVTNSLAKNKAALPPGHNKNNLPIAFLIESSTFSDTDGEPGQETNWKEHDLQEIDLSEEKNNAPESKHLFSRDSSQPEVQKDKNKAERMATDGDREKSQKYMAEDIQLRKQSSSESEPGHYRKENTDSNPKKGRKPRSQKSAKQGRRAKLKERRSPSCDTEIKVDFPDQLVQAHHNTYAYLNPNLCKYEAIISMTNQATQTQLIMQQMVYFLSLRFDEINRTLEEISNDGEQLLKDVGKNLAWPLEKGDSREQPDLLPQLLQYTINKMQVLNETVASLTSDVLQDTYSYLESAAASLQEKLLTKQRFDERLQNTMKLLESFTIGSYPSVPNDVTLYSEDSGLGADNESIKECGSTKLGRKASSSSLGEVFPKENLCISSAKENLNGLKTCDCVLGTHLKDCKHPTMVTFCPTTTQAYTSSMPETISLTSMLSLNSLDSIATLEPENSSISESTESVEEEEDDSPSEDSERLSQRLMNICPQRPMTSPARTGAHRGSTKWIENPKNEEMTLKIKDAISEKIKFVPVQSGSNIWTEVEGLQEYITRPNTSSGSRTHKVRHRRSRSAESLKSQAEDPTLLELQRTQKELSKRLEKMHSLNRNACLNGKEKIPKHTEQPPLKYTDGVVLSASMNKLKASLDKHFGILPNQDKVSFNKQSPNGESSTDEESRQTERAPILTQESKHRIENESFSTRKLESGSSSPRQSVKKLIETFTPSANIVRSTNPRSLGPLKCIQKFGVPVLPPSIPIHRVLEPLNDTRFDSTTGDSDDKSSDSPTEDTNQTYIATFPPLMPAVEFYTDSSEGFTEDLENLPPPPPEILMDNSSGILQYEESVTSVESNNSETSNQCAKKDPEAPKKRTSSEKIKATLSAIDVLPSKHFTIMTGNTVPRNNLKSNRFALELNPTSLSDCDHESVSAIQRNQEKEEAAQLYKQSHKIIPLQNPGSVSKPSDSEASKEPTVNGSSVQNQKPNSPVFSRRNERSPTRTRVSPTKLMPFSSPTESMLTSPNRYMHMSMSPMPPKPPSNQKYPSPPISPGSSSPPIQRKLPSPPSQRKMPSPPSVRKPSNPASQRRMASPPGSRRGGSPPPYCTTPSPPISPSFLHRRLQNSLDACDTTKIGSNAQSIFCPSSSSMFESKPPSPPSSPLSQGATIQSHTPGPPARKNGYMLKQAGDQQRKVAMSAANPQPFVRRCFSERRPRIQFRLPDSISALACSEPDLPQMSAEDTARKAGVECHNKYVAEPKRLVRTSSNDELCIVGQGLQKD